MNNDNNFQTDTWVTDKAITQLTENNNRSVSAMFREFRRYQHYSLLGDYVLLASIARALAELKLPKTRKDFSYTMRQSVELKELSKRDKTSLLDELIKMPSVGLKNEKDGYSTIKTREDGQEGIRSLVYG